MKLYDKIEYLTPGNGSQGIYHIQPLSELNQDRLDRLLFGHVLKGNIVGFHATYIVLKEREKTKKNIGFRKVFLDMAGKAL